MKRNKANKIIMENRIDIIFDLLIKGFSRREIIAELSKNPVFGGIRTSMIDKLIRVAKERILAIKQEQREYNYNIAIIRLELLFQKAITNKDYKTALFIQKEINSLQGLNIENQLFTKLMELNQQVSEFIKGKGNGNI